LKYTKCDAMCLKLEPILSPLFLCLKEWVQIPLKNFRITVIIALAQTLILE
jgi:hypothetical protein